MKLRMSWSSEEGKRIVNVNVNGESEAEVDARRRRRAHRRSWKARSRKVEEHSQRSPIRPFSHFSFQHRPQGKSFNNQHFFLFFNPITIGLGFLKLPLFQDKWRNLSVSNGSQGSKDKPRVPKLKALPPPPPPTSATSSTTTTAPQNAPPAPLNVQAEVAALDSSLNDQDVKNPPRYESNTMYVLCSLLICAG